MHYICVCKFISLAVNQKNKFLKKKLFGDLSFLLVPLAFSWFTSRLSLGFSLFSSIYLSSFLSPVDCRVSINSRIHSQQKVVFLTLQIWQEFVINLLIFNNLCLQYLQKKIMRIWFLNILKIFKKVWFLNLGKIWGKSWLNDTLSFPIWFYIFYIFNICLTHMVKESSSLNNGWLSKHMYQHNSIFYIFSLLYFFCNLFICIRSTFFIKMYISKSY